MSGFLDAVASFYEAAVGEGGWTKTMDHRFEQAEPVRLVLSVAQTKGG